MWVRYMNVLSELWLHRSGRVASLQRPSLWRPPRDRSLRAASLVSVPLCAHAQAFKQALDAADVDKLAQLCAGVVEVAIRSHRLSEAGVRALVAAMHPNRTVNAIRIARNSIGGTHAAIVLDALQ